MSTYQHLNNNTLTIMPTPANAMTTDRKPSEMFMVTDCETRDVSAERRLISSPVLLVSKKPISCFITEANTRERNDRVMRWPGRWEEMVSADRRASMSLGKSTGMKELRIFVNGLLISNFFELFYFILFFYTKLHLYWFSSG